MLVYLYFTCTQYIIRAFQSSNYHIVNVEVAMADTALVSRPSLLNKVVHLQFTVLLPDSSADVLYL